MYVAIHTHFCFLRFLNLKVHSGPWGDPLSLKAVLGDEQRPPSCVPSPEALRTCEQQERSLSVSWLIGGEALAAGRARLAQPWGGASPTRRLCLWQSHAATLWSWHGSRSPSGAELGFTMGWSSGSCLWWKMWILLANAVRLSDV